MTYVSKFTGTVIDNAIERVQGLDNEFDAKQDKLTEAQITSTNSGITAEKVVSYDGYASLIASKQPLLTDEQQAAADSGITAGKVTIYDNWSVSIDGKQDKLVSGTNIKTINNNSIVGSGNLEIKVAADADNVTITKNTSDALQAVGVLDGKTNAADKFITLTRAEFDAIETKDSNTFYHITDDVDTSLNILYQIFPVGALYSTTGSSCPLAGLFGTWQLIDSRAAQTGGYTINTYRRVA